MHSDSDPIVAIATAPGRGGIGIVRVSGANLTPVIEAVLGPAHRTLVPRYATHCTFLGERGEPLDDGIALYFPARTPIRASTCSNCRAMAGRSCCACWSRAASRRGAPWACALAEPGEFTRRAFLNDRLDLAQAEAVADLIDALDRGRGALCRAFARPASSRAPSRR